MKLLHPNVAGTKHPPNKITLGVVKRDLNNYPIDLRGLKQPLRSDGTLLSMTLAFMNLFLAQN